MARPLPHSLQDSTPCANTESASSNSLQDFAPISDIKSASPVQALQDFVFPYPVDSNNLTDEKPFVSALAALQDLAIWQNTVLHGLAAHLYGDSDDALQDFAFSFLRQCYDKGKRIFSVSPRGAQNTTTSNKKGKSDEH